MLKAIIYCSTWIYIVHYMNNGRQQSFEPSFVTHRGGQSRRTLTYKKLPSLGSSILYCVQNKELLEYWLLVWVIDSLLRLLCIVQCRACIELAVYLPVRYHCEICMHIAYLLPSFLLLFLLLSWFPHCIVGSRFLDCILLVVANVMSSCERQRCVQWYDEPFY